jgi:uncharacterized membrane protein
MLFTAYVMHLIWKVPKVGGKQLLILGILLALLAPCKMVYIPLALLCFLIPPEKFGSKKQFWIGAALVAVMMAGGILLVNLDKILVYVKETEETVDWADAAAGYSISYVMAHPLQVLGVLGRTIIQKGPTYVSTMLGGTLGCLDHSDGAVLYGISTYGYSTYGNSTYGNSTYGNSMYGNSTYRNNTHGNNRFPVIFVEKT